jgi:uncharacterized protein YegJ (DUF2314 family)
MRIAVLAASLMVLLVGSARAESLLDLSKRDDVARIEKGNPDMAAAFKKARGTLPQFLKLALAPPPNSRGFAVKIGIPYDDRRNAEFFWITPFKPQGDKYVGNINNTPRSAKTVKLGQTIEFTETEIVDWLYQENGRMVGNYTACALLKREPPQQAAAFMKQYGLRCDP